MSAPRTSGTNQTLHVDAPAPARRGIRDRLAAWWMGRVAGRYCPCEWPIRIPPLIRLCGRIDDRYVRRLLP